MLNAKTALKDTTAFQKVKDDTLCISSRTTACWWFHPRSPVIVLKTNTLQHYIAHSKRIQNPYCVIWFGQKADSFRTLPWEQLLPDIDRTNNSTEAINGKVCISPFTIIWYLRGMVKYDVWSCHTSSRVFSNETTSSIFFLYKHLLITFLHKKKFTLMFILGQTIDYHTSNHQFLTLLVENGEIWKNVYILLELQLNGVP